MYGLATWAFFSFHFTCCINVGLHSVCSLMSSFIFFLSSYLIFFQLHNTTFITPFKLLQQLHYHTTINTPPSTHHHQHTTINTPPSTHHHQHTTINTPPSPHHHHHTTITTPPSPPPITTPHHHTTITTPPSPHHHHHTIITTPGYECSPQEHNILIGTCPETMERCNSYEDFQGAQEDMAFNGWLGGGRI